MSTSITRELHRLVDQIGDERATEALAYLRGLVEQQEAEGPAMEKVARLLSPPTTSGPAFVAQQRIDLARLAEQQGVRPVTDMAALRGDFWPDDEPADAFAAAVRRWRREGGPA